MILHRNPFYETISGARGLFLPDVSGLSLHEAALAYAEASARVGASSPAVTPIRLMSGGVPTRIMV